VNLLHLPGFKYRSRTQTARLTVIIPGTRGRVRRRKKLVGVTRDEALGEWKRFREFVLSGRVAPTDPTLRNYWQEFRATMMSRLGRKTAANQRSIIETDLLPFLGDYRLSRISLGLLKDLVAQMRNRGLAPASINGRLSVLRKVLHDAVDRGVVEFFPVRGRWPREKEMTPKNELSEAEMEAFLATFERRDAFLLDEDFHRFRGARPLFVAALETGLSRSDLLSLRWRSVDLVGGWVRVPRQKTSVESLIPISSRCREAFEECSRRTLVGEFIFLTERGRPYSITTFTRYFRKAKQIAKITRRFRAHDLRHTFASRLASAGVPIQIIAKALGHASARMSERYARPNEDSLRMVLAALSREEHLDGKSNQDPRPLQNNQR
jgi:integrase